ncbi:MAG: hypothetical protein ACMG6H_10465, partial [Acidobacteriota bacterium]
LLIVLAAMFVANGAIAAARACMVGLDAHAHTAVRVLDCSGEEPLCPEAAATAQHYLVDCTQCYKGDKPGLFFDTPAVAIAPHLSLHRAWFQPAPRQLVIASVPPVGGPPLTILFGNLRI